MSDHLRKLLSTHGGRDVLLSLHQYCTTRGPPDAAGVRELAATTGLPEASVRAAVSYYGDLARRPGTVRLCRGTSCALDGVDRVERALADRAQGSVYCLGYCDRSPAALRADGRPVVRCSTARLDDLLGDEPPPIPPPPAMRCNAAEPVVLRRAGRGDFSDLAKARADGAYEALRRALGMSPAAVLDLVDASGLRGRGGAGFPTGRKWRAGAAAPGPVKYVVANGDEGDPGSFIDRVLMEQDPHAVLEGLAICAWAVGASEGIVFIRSEYPAAIETMRRAIGDARRAGLLASFDVSVFPGLGSYVCGEETAMLNAIEGLRGEVRLRPPYPTERGLWGRPTVVNNVETLVTVPWIIEHGAEAYAALGTRECSGTKAICLNHGFPHSGIVEVEFGVLLRDVVEEAGGADLDAVLLGGPMGSFLSRGRWDVPVCYSAMSKRGIQLGHGGIVGVPNGTDGRALLLHWLRFMQHESCGRCVPCRIGSRRAIELVDGAGNVDRALLDRLLDVIADGSLCAFGQQMPRPMRAMIEHFGIGSEAAP